MRDVFKNIVDSYDSTDANDMYEVEEEVSEPVMETAPDEVVPVILEEHVNAIEEDTEPLIEEVEDENMKHRLTLGLHSDSLDHHSDGIRKHSSPDNDEEFDWEVIKHHLTGIKEIVDKIESIIPTDVPDSFEA